MPCTCILLAPSKQHMTSVKSSITCRFSPQTLGFASGLRLYLVQSVENGSWLPFSFSSSPVSPQRVSSGQLSLSQATDSVLLRLNPFLLIESFTYKRAGSSLTREITISDFYQLYVYEVWKKSVFVSRIYDLINNRWAFLPGYIFWFPSFSFSSEKQLEKGFAKCEFLERIRNWITRFQGFHSENNTFYQNYILTHSTESEKQSSVPSHTRN